MTQIDRCDALYDELQFNDRGWVKLDTLLLLLSDVYPMSAKARLNPHNSTARRVLTRDIAYINASPEYEKVIIHGDQGVKIATEEEATRFFGAKKAELARAFHALRTFGKKIGLDGQIDLDGDVVEAFAGE